MWGALGWFSVFLCALSSSNSSVLESTHIIQQDGEADCNVKLGSLLSGGAPTTFSAKNELLPHEIFSSILETVDVDTDLRIPRDVYTTNQQSILPYCM